MTTPEWSKEDRSRRFDTIDDASTADMGTNYAISLARNLHAFGVTLPSDARYLAVGAGQAHAELQFATQLGINESRITLLDKGFSAKALRRFSNMSYSGEQIEEDVFDFLEKPSADKYDVVTAMGMEYIFTTPHLERYIAALSTRINPNGAAIITPSKTRHDMTPIWNNHGFTSLLPAASGIPTRYEMLFRS